MSSAPFLRGDQPTSVMCAVSIDAISGIPPAAIRSASKPGNSSPIARRPELSRKCGCLLCGTPRRCSASGGSSSRSRTSTSSKCGASAPAADRPAMLPPRTTAVRPSVMRRPSSSIIQSLDDCMIDQLVNAVDTLQCPQIRARLCTRTASSRWQTRVHSTELHSTGPHGAVTRLCGSAAAAGVSQAPTRSHGLASNHGSRSNHFLGRYFSGAGGVKFRTATPSSSCSAASPSSAVVRVCPSAVAVRASSCR